MSKWRTSQPTATSAALVTLGFASMVMTVAYLLVVKSKHDTENETTPSRQTTDDDDDDDNELALLTRLPSHLRREAMKEKRRKEKIKLLAMKTPMYDNVKMLDQNGDHLCNISRKKGRWYVSKNLATWTTSQQQTIQLNFEPKNRSNDDGIEATYVKSTKKNRCVSCGDDSYHMRHYIVPFAYRTRFPARFKSHLSHDIVILCPDCHVYCERESQWRMKDLNESYVPRDARRKRFEVDRELYQVRSSALALLRWRKTIPEDKVRYHERVVRDYYSMTDDDEGNLTDERLRQAADVDYQIEEKGYMTGPEWVVKALGSDEDKIADFVRDWRRHFLDTARPRFLPEGWSVSSSVTCGRD